MNISSINNNVQENLLTEIEAIETRIDKLEYLKDSELRDLLKKWHTPEKINDPNSAFYLREWRGKVFEDEALDCHQAAEEQRILEKRLNELVSQLGPKMEVWFESNLKKWEKSRLELNLGSWPTEAAEKIRQAFHNNKTSLKLLQPHLQSLPRCINQLRELENLVLRCNAIRYLPDLSNLIKLKSLDLEGNYLLDSSPLDSLRTLTWLNVTHNRLKNLSSIPLLPNLQILFAWDNPLAEIPDFSGHLHLKHLHISDNTDENLFHLFLKVPKQCTLHQYHPLQFPPLAPTVFPYRLRQSLLQTECERQGVTFFRCKLAG